MSARPNAAPTEPAAVRWWKPLLVALLASFALRALYLAAVTPHAIPADEIEHFGRAAIFAQTPGLPADTSESHPFGLMRDRPYLYHWLMGRLLAWTPFPSSGDLLFLRGVNVGLSLLTLGFGARAMATLSPNPVVRLAFLVMLSHTLMFTFQSASVSYDNLANLCAAVGFDALFAWCRDRAPRRLWRLAAAGLAGTLTKLAFAPLAAIWLVTVLWRERRGLAALLRGAAAWLTAPGVPGAALALAVAGLLAANVALYGGNLVRHGALVPRCEQVLPLDACLRRPNTARDWIFDEYRAGRLSADAALERAATLAHPQLRRDTRYLVRNYESWNGRGRPLVDRFRYAFAWSDKMARGIYGILGHASMSQPAWRQVAFELLLLFTLLSAARRWRPGEDDGIVGVSLFATLAYGLMLMQFVNYPVYAASGSMNLALQGRYLFPVVVPLYALVARFCVEPLPPRGQWAATALIAALFVSGDLPFYLAERTPVWTGGS